MRFKTEEELVIYFDRLYREDGMFVTAAKDASGEGVLFAYDWDAGCDIEVGRFTKKGEYYYI